MATTLENVVGDTAARILRTQQLAAGGSAALQMRRMQAMAASGWVSTRGPRNLSFNPLAALSGAAPRSYPVTVEEQAPEPEPKPRPTYGPSKAKLCAFILQQMIEAKDEAAQAACCRYTLRNRLLG